jgi:hypothetical protein
MRVQGDSTSVIRGLQENLCLYSILIEFGVPIKLVMLVMFK